MSGILGPSAQLIGTESDCALVYFMGKLHSREAQLAERKLAVVAEFFTRRSAECQWLLAPNPDHTVTVDSPTGHVLRRRRLTDYGDDPPPF